MNNLSAHISQICRFLCFANTHFELIQADCCYGSTRSFCCRVYQRSQNESIAFETNFTASVYVQIENKLLFAACALPAKPQQRRYHLTFRLVSEALFGGSICAGNVQLNLKSEPFHFIDVIPDSDLTVTRRCANYYFCENKILFSQKCVKKCMAAVKKDFIAREKSQAAKSLSFPLIANFFHETKRC